MTDRPRQPPQQKPTREDNEQQSGKPPRHEGDEPIAQRDEQEPRSVGKQGHHDLERGLKDTDLRGGGEYQENTQNDGHANRNSQPGGEKSSGGA